MAEIPEDQLKDFSYYWASWTKTPNDVFIVRCDSAYRGQFSMCGCDEIIHIGEILVFEEVKSYD